MTQSHIIAPGRIGFAMTLACLVLSVPAHAQSIDRDQMEALFGEPVTLSATGAPQRASDVPAAMTIITGEEIRRSGATNLAEALRGHAGIDVNRFGAQQYDVSIRGGNQPLNPRLLVMIDGRQVYQDNYGYTSWANLGIELSEIRQVEIVRGPMSALFGFNAAEGVINIITYNPVTDARNSLSAQIGNDGARVVSGVGTIQAGDRFGVRASGGYSIQDEYPQPGYARPYRANLGLDAGYDLSSKVSARLAYNFSKSRQDITAFSFLPVSFAIKSNAAQAKVSADTEVGLLDAQIYYTALVNAYDLTGDTRNDGSFHNDTLIARIQDIFKPDPRDTIRGTLEFRRNSEAFLPDLDGTVAYNIYSGGLMIDHAFSAAITVNLSGRVDYLSLGQSGSIDPLVPLNRSDFNQRFIAWSANAGLVIHPDALSTLRFQLARGLQSPSLISLGTAVSLPFAPGVTGAFTGNPQLNPTIVESGETGYSRKLAPLGATLDIALFYTRTRDLVTLLAAAPELDASGVTLSNFFVQGGSYDSYGAEVILKGVVRAGLTWQIDYSYDRVTDHFAPAVLAANQPFAALTPRHKLGLTLGYQTGPLTFDVRPFLRSRVEYPGNGRFSGWTAGFDGRVGWRPTSEIELFVAGENVSSAAYIDNGAARQDRRVLLGVSFAGR